MESSGTLEENPPKQIHLTSEFMKKVRLPTSKFKIPRTIKILMVLVILAALAYGSFLEYIRPYEYGIKVNKIGFQRGVQKKVYETGLYLVLPFGVQEMHKLPRGLQVLELTNSAETAAYDTRIERAAHIQTSDGFFVDVDVSIIYRVNDPYKVFTDIGPGRLFEDNGIIPKTEPALKNNLGKLTTEEFFNSPMRVEKALATKQELNEELKEKGILVEHVLVRYFHYSDEIQKNIEEKKLKDQLVFKNKSEARAAIEGAKLTKIEQEGKVLVAVELEKGKAYVTRKQAEKDLYYRKKDETTEYWTLET
ncbi:MAG TPA: SPFH domain-containing protein, partial [Desulfobacter postgatei]|nr:SPFH domain-containing protein [Desulfobacter postgatei]